MVLVAATCVSAEGCGAMTMTIVLKFDFAYAFYNLQVTNIRVHFRSVNCKIIKETRVLFP